MTLRHPNSYRRLAFLGLFLVLVVMAVAAVLLSTLLDPRERGSFGDMFGVVNALFTGIGLVAIAVTLHLQRDQAQDQRMADFENELNQEYRQLVEKLPVHAFLPVGGSSPPDIQDEDLRMYYRYFDLSNSQVFWRMQERISEGMWEGWGDGIVSNMGLPGFEQAWQIVQERRSAHRERDPHLQYLYRLLQEGGKDPARWQPQAESPGPQPGQALAGPDRSPRP